MGYSLLYQREFIYLCKPNQVLEKAMINPIKKERINEKGYLIPYIADGRTLVKVGVNFSQKERNIEHWIIE